jgi:broad specificity phosphatase PhoE
MEYNIRQIKLKADAKDYEESKILDYFTEKIKKSILPFETIQKTESPSLSFIKVFSIGKNFETYNINGFLQSKLLSYLMNLQMNAKPIYFIRHGESAYNLENRIGGDSELTEKGHKLGGLLKKFFEVESKNSFFKFSEEKPKIFTSSLKRAKQTAEYIDLDVRVISTKVMDEIDSGIYDGLSYDEIKEKFPLEYYARDNDKLRYRYPRGESYLDLIQRLEPIIFEIERAKGPVIIVNFLFLMIFFFFLI